LKVLLIVTDLFIDTGGGQSVYRKIVNELPEITFFYFIKAESLTQNRPSNARSIELKQPKDVKITNDSNNYSYCIEALQNANIFARSVSGMSFDIVDFPDFNYFGNTLKIAFDKHQVKVGKFVLAMHGNVSNSIRLNWGYVGPKIENIVKLEKEQFILADSVYAISSRYRNHYLQFYNREVSLIDPLNFIEFKELERPKDEITDAKPSIYCIGRMERLKGNDVFLNIIKFLNKDLYNHFYHLGGEDFSNNGESAKKTLNRYAENRGLENFYLQNMPQNDLFKFFNKSRALIILPVRFDTFNLVALEAIMNGCPMAISTNAGICDYLDEEYPFVPYIKFKNNDFFQSIKQMEEVLSNYDFYKQTLIDHVKAVRNSFVPNLEQELSNFYQNSMSKISETSDSNYTFLYREINFSMLRFLKNVCRLIFSQRVILKLLKIKSDIFYHQNNTNVRREVTQLDDNLSLGQEVINVAQEIFKSSGKSKPAISICVPLLSENENIEVFIHSLMLISSFTTGRIELVLIDSTIDKKYLNYYEKLALSEDINVIYLYKLGLTDGSARNFALGHLNGDFIIQSVVDQFFYPNSLNEIFNMFQENQTNEFVISDVLYCEFDQEMNFERDIKLVKGLGKEKEEYSIESKSVSFIGAMYKKELHAKFGYFDESKLIYEQGDFFNRLLIHIKVMPSKIKSSMVNIDSSKFEKMF
jgi:glycosyltransferase involved in cell wall biosynthesis